MILWKLLAETVKRVTELEYPNFHHIEGKIAAALVYGILKTS